MQTSDDICPDCGEWKREEYERCYTCNMKEAGKELCPQCNDKYYDPKKWKLCYTCHQDTKPYPEQKKEAMQDFTLPLTSLLFLDTETTGFKFSRMIQLAYAHTNGHTCSLLVRPPHHIEKGATEVNGIRDEDVQDLAPFTETEEFEKVKALVSSSIFIAHNAPYDIGVLGSEGIFVQPRRFICTQQVAMKVFPYAKNHKLQSLREELRINVTGDAHSADGDVSVLVELFYRLLITYRLTQGKTYEQAIMDFISFSTR